MSIEAMTAVWADSTYKGNKRMILLALAWFADGEGQNCFPSLGTIASMSNNSERNVRQLLRQLENAGAIRIQFGHGRGQTNEYDLSPLLAGATSHPPAVRQKGKISTEKGKSSAQRGKNWAQKGDQAIPRSLNDPLSDPLKEKSPFDALKDVSLPSHLNTQEFWATWQEWEQHRREIGAPLNQTARKRQLAQASQFSYEEVALVIGRSIENGWKGLFWEKLSQPSRASSYKQPQSNSTPIQTDSRGLF